MHTPTSIHNFLDKHHSVTFQLGWSTTIICLSTLQFGFHLAELNAPEDILACNFHKPGPYPDYNDTFWSHHGYKQCIPMTQEGVALITTMFTIGGLISSIILGATSISQKFGRKYMCLVSSLGYILGSLIMTLANNQISVNVGRFINGFAAGSSLIMSPILINELTPINHRGLLGSLLQLAVTIGIFLSQIISYFFSNDQQWRFIFLCATGLGLIQFLTLFTVSESPKWMIMQGHDVKSATNILHGLRSDKSTVHYEINHWRQLSINEQNRKSESVDDTSALLSESDSYDSLILPLVNQRNNNNSRSTAMARKGSIDPSTVTTREFMFSKKYRNQFVAVILLMTAQQLVGMNAITYYGVKILNDLFGNHHETDGDQVLILSCSFSFVNVLSAIAISPLIDRLGRRPLILLSIFICSICSLVIGVGIINQYDVAVITACFGFIIGFSIGLGPIPFLMISELSGHEVVSIAQSVGTSTNWLANILIAFGFPILQNSIGGSVFFIFLVNSIGYLFAIWYYVPETKGYNSVQDVWDNFT
ncbi:hexose transporter of the major facilitator superfamily [Scheffersomyces coipomensis]|uniref:hexose transporter of the major facilitator superfamily n=1 Tax=Scheffersomyces coipomensis TaxID=1788519 RepID=UPI00315C78E9